MTNLIRKTTILNAAFRVYTGFSRESCFVFADEEEINGLIGIKVDANTRQSKLTVVVTLTVNLEE